MSRANLKVMTIDQLVEGFVELCVAQSEALDD